MSNIFDITIVTVSKNNLSGLKKTVESVSSQLSTNVQHLIIDCLSTDGTQHYLPLLTHPNQAYISEHDEGIYHGMNKCLLLSNTKYLWFLNSGDTPFPGAISLVLSLLVSEPELVFGETLFITPTSTITLHPPLHIPSSLKSRNSIPHPSTIISFELFRSLGPYNTLLSIIADYYFFLEVFTRYTPRYLTVSRPLATMSSGGISDLRFSASPPFIKLLKEYSFLYRRFYGIIHSLSMCT